MREVAHVVSDGRATSHFMGAEVLGPDIFEWNEKAIVVVLGSHKDLVAALVDTSTYSSSSR